MPGTTAHPDRPHPISPFLIKEIAEVLAQDALDQGDATLVDAQQDSFIPSFELTARTVLEALRDRHLPDTAAKEMLTEDQVSRILFHYDPSGTAYADIARLAHSHERLRRRLAARESLIDAVAREAEEEDTRS